MSGWDQLGDFALTATQIALRDGTAAAPPAEGAARQRRITQMQADIAWCQDFVADCDRWADSTKRHNPCVKPDVPLMVRRFIADERAKAVATQRRLHDELAVLRGGT